MTSNRNKEVPAFVCSHVFQKERDILLVSREDGDWQLLCGEEHASDERPRVIGLNHLFEQDPTLLELKDLPVNWEAEREKLGAIWRKSKVR